ncbi:MAG: hypothetical protein IRZ00_03290 [Gemmatimonadetes bacterium]|nr:hypothetical protein [Gemmatimonadota bacterium]
MNAPPRHAHFFATAALLSGIIVATRQLDLPRSRLSELKRRNVWRAAALYAAAAWLLVHVATQVFPLFHVPDGFLRGIVVVAILGFPFSIAFAWLYELTPEGLKRESEVDPAESISFAFKGKDLEVPEIARRLNVANVLEGSVRRAGDEGRGRPDSSARPTATRCGRRAGTASWAMSSRSRTRSPRT